MAASTVTTVPALSRPPLHPDSALLRLGEELDRAPAVLAAINAMPVGICTDEILGAMLRPIDEAVRRIEKEQAHTLEGLLVQARAVAWCRSDEPFCADDMALHLESKPTTDVRLAMVIANGLMAMARKATAQ